MRMALATRAAPVTDSLCLEVTFWDCTTLRVKAASQSYTSYSMLYTENIPIVTSTAQSAT